MEKEEISLQDELLAKIGKHTRRFENRMNEITGKTEILSQYKEMQSNFGKELDEEFQIRIRSNKEFQNLFEEFDDLSSIIESDFEKQSQKMALDLDNHPWIDEEELLDEIHETPINKLQQKVENKDLFTLLDNRYPETDMNPQFFKELLMSQQSGEKNQSKYLKQVRDGLLKRWSALLSQKINRWRIKRIDELRNELIELLREKLEKMNSINKSMRLSNDSIGRLWNDSDGNWRKSNFELMSSYFERYMKDPVLQKVVEELGRGDITTSSNEATKTSSIMTNLPNKGTFGSEEIIGIHESDDINHLLSSELGLLTTETLETLFYQKLVEKKLLSFDLTGISIITETDKRELPKPQNEKGPIVICVDTSGSMEGAPEEVAKTLTYATARKAILEDRPCYIISFSTGIRTFDIPDIKGLPELSEFLQFSFNGGTSFDAPLREAIRIISEDERYGKADILVISDFVLGSLDNYTAFSIQKMIQQEVEMHSFVISNSANREILQNFTNNWTYRLDEVNTVLEKFDPLSGDIL